jgi:hypothetical protein
MKKKKNNKNMKIEKKENPLKRRSSSKNVFYRQVVGIKHPKQPNFEVKRIGEGWKRKRGNETLKRRPRGKNVFVYSTVVGVKNPKPVGRPVDAIVHVLLLLDLKKLNDGHITFYITIIIIYYIKKMFYILLVLINNIL